MMDEYPEMSFRWIGEAARKMAEEKLKTLKEVTDNMMQVVPNSGTLMDDYLDDLRGKAILAASISGLPFAVVEYIQALEHNFIQSKFRDREKWLKEISFKVK